MMITTNPNHQIPESDLTHMSGESLLMLAIRKCKNQSISRRINNELESRSRDARCEQGQRMYLFPGYPTRSIAAN